MSGALRAAMLADRSGLEARHPDVFRPDWASRIKRVVVIGGLAGLFVYGLASMEAS